MLHPAYMPFSCFQSQEIEEISEDEIETDSREKSISDGKIKICFSFLGFSIFAGIHFSIIAVGS